MIRGSFCRRPIKRAQLASSGPVLWFYKFSSQPASARVSSSKLAARDGLGSLAHTLACVLLRRVCADGGDRDQLVRGL